MKKPLQYPYLFLLAASFLFAGSAWKLGYIDLNTTTIFPDIGFEAKLENSPADLSNTESAVSAVQGELLSEMDASTEDSLTNEEIQTETDVLTNEEILSNHDTSSEESAPAFFEADRTYFDNALFIGDSRTVGLYEYGGLGNAITLADTGMSVYKIFKQSFSVDSGKRMTLEEILTEKQFEKIYIMLGINELGYDFDQTVRRYQEMVTTIETLQPNSLIYLQANLHITEKKSNSSPIYNNESINRFNAEVEKMADSRKRFYLDVNELFDDENGNLSTDYTVDESHVLGKYYADWVDWILKHAVPIDAKH